MEENKAIALGYKKIEKVPEIISIAKGRLCKLLLDIAREKDIPVYKDYDLAELLSKLKPGQEVPEFLYKAIVEVFSFCYQVNKNFRNKIINNK